MADAATRNRFSSRGFLTIAGVVLCIAVAAPVLASSDGYEGLIAPSKPEPSQEYGSAKGEDEAPGYSGLIPGHVEKNVEEPPEEISEAPATGDEQMQQSPVPGFVKPVRPHSAMDLSMLSVGYGGNVDEIGKTLKVSGEAARTLNKPRDRAEGMLPMELMAKMQIEKLMPPVIDTELPDNVRAENAEKAYKELGEMADGIRQKKSVPDEVYRNMGVPETFIKEEKEGIEAALAHLDIALDELRKYQ